MAPKEITLALAAFLDSRASIALPAPDRAGQRLLIEAFLHACYEDLGTAPRHLDRESMQAAFSRHLPARLKPMEPLAAYAAPVVEAFMEHLGSIQTVAFAFEAKLGLHDSESAFLAAVDSRETARHSTQETVTHGASKLGRNDPCSCGSGKKYKKCHGRGL